MLGLLSYLTFWFVGNLSRDDDSRKEKSFSSPVWQLRGILSLSDLLNLIPLYLSHLSLCLCLFLYILLCLSILSLISAFSSFPFCLFVYPLFLSLSFMLNNFAPPASFPSATSPANGRGFPAANSPGPIELYNSGQESLGYVQATSPQPSGFGPSITTNRGPLITATCSATGTNHDWLWRFLLWSTSVSLSTMTFAIKIFQNFIFFFSLSLSTIFDFSFLPLLHFFYTAISFFPFFYSCFLNPFFPSTSFSCSIFLTLFFTAFFFVPTLPCFLFFSPF
ncbi:MSI [Acanthosepion pharaonis]|uniref:MSI n=1 Tax=Acanthosepion pharaonis TaxID=158019 RepID=A0A812CB45_ACAPH|nr:MSI [Sepia pharaonis]